MKPLDVTAYHRYLQSLMGDETPRWNASAPIIGIIDAIFVLTVQRRAEELRFEVRDDDGLDVRMRTDDTWTELLPLDCPGSAISRLRVLGHLEKGAGARAKAQTAVATILGCQMVFNTEPVRPWREHVRVRIGNRLTI